MIDVTMLPLFFTAAFFLIISPGPDLVLISAYSSSKGVKSGVMIALGVFIAGIVQTLLVAFGLGQLMQTMPMVAYSVKIVGAAYLAYLGVTMLKAWFSKREAHLSMAPQVGETDVKLLTKGLLNNLLNPKALIFFSLFLPQFTTGQAGLTMQIMLLGFMLSVMAFVINCTFAFVFAKCAQLIGNKFTAGRHVDGILGAIFMALAVRLAISK